MSNLSRVPGATVRDWQDHHGLPKDGNSVVILRANGTVGPFTVGEDSEALIAKLQQDEGLPDFEQGQIDASQRAFALNSIALSPKVMAARIEVADQLGFLDQDAIDGLGRPN